MPVKKSKQHIQYSSTIFIINECHHTIKMKLSTRIGRFSNNETRIIINNLNMHRLILTKRKI